MLKCVIPNWFLAWRNLDSRVTDESPTEGFTPSDLSKLCCRCAKLYNIADVVFVRFGLNASWYNLLANHIVILAAKDTCLPDPTPNEVIMSDVDPTVVGKVKAMAERIASSQLKEPSDATKKIDSQSFRSWAWCSFCEAALILFNAFDLVQSFDFVQSFDLVQSSDLVQSFNLVLCCSQDIDLSRHASVAQDVVEDALAQGAKGLRLMQNEDHQVLRNKKKVEEDAPDCTKVDDDGVEFSPEGGGYFPTMGDETKKDKCSIFLLLLIICLVFMLMERVSYLQSIQRRSEIRFMFLLLDLLNKEIFKDLTVCEDVLDRSLSLAEILKTETMSSLGPLNQYDEPMWAANRVVAPTPGFTITIPEMQINLLLKKNNPRSSKCHSWWYFLYQTPNQAYQLLEDKVLLKLDWAKNQKTKTSLKKTVAFVDEGSSDSDTDKIMARIDAMTIKMDAQYKELQPQAKQPTPLDDDDMPMSHEEEAKFMQTFLIQVKRKQLNLGVGTERMIFNIDSTMKHSYSNDDTCFSIDIIDEILEEDFDALLDEGRKILHSIEGTLLEEEIFAEFNEFMAMTTDENSESKSKSEEPPFEKIAINTDYKIKTSLEEPPTDLKLEPISNNLEYVFLEEPSFLPLIISSKLSTQNKSKLVFILKKHKEAFAWKTTDILGICPSFCKHKIQLLDDKKQVFQKQRRLNPTMQEVVKKEIMKLLYTGIIYPIADSPLVSPI
nr:reverse transcriptase domain-containing protein [Tanacetum cinerariifolium]